MASDPDGDSLSYQWSVSGGTLSDDNTNPTNWTTPITAGPCAITVTASDDKGKEDTQTLDVTVQTPPSMNLPVDEVGFIEDDSDIGSLAVIVGDGGMVERDLGTHRPDGRARTGMPTSGRVSGTRDVRILVDRRCRVVVVDLPPGLGWLIGCECYG